MSYFRHTSIIRISMALTMLLLQLYAVCQEKPKTDSFFLARKKGWLGKLGKSISVNVATLEEPSVIALMKNINPYIQFKGSVIRKISVSKIGFGQSVNDTAKVVRNIFNDIGQKLHVSTSEKTIKHNLFFKEGDKIYPYLLADNERYLRTIPYLQDARIVLHEVPDPESETDSVDVVIFYKDVFPISGAAVMSNPTSMFLEGRDENLRGNGDRIIIQTLYDYNRNPNTGIGAEYMKRNISGSFINVSAGYQNLAPNFSSGKREENMAYARINLPLVSPYHPWTGSLEIASHSTENDYSHDTLFYSNYNYRYNQLDGWIGYNIGSRKLLHELVRRKINEFIALRITGTNFTELPLIYKNIYNFQYASQRNLLAAYTIFKQDYYKTSFIYGFGRTEDVPEGFNASVIAGWTRKNQYERPYLGFELQRNYFNRNESYFNFDFRAGSYFKDGSFQDVSLLGSLESFSKLMKINNSRWSVRQFLSGSITQQINNFLNQPLLLNSTFGIPEYSNPDTTGSTRITLHSQTLFFNSWKFFGFSFAPFTFGDFCYLKPIAKPIGDGDGYIDFGAGVRTRNENLVFGTIELKVYYFPRTTMFMSPWNITVNSGLIFKYVSQFIKRPDFVPVN